MSIPSMCTPRIENDSDFVGPEAFFFVSSGTRPTEIQESVLARAERFQAVASPLELSARPALRLFFPSSEARIELSQVWAIIERVM